MEKGQSKAPVSLGCGPITASPGSSLCLATAQLQDLEQSFRIWAKDAGRADVRQSRRRILLIFLLIRYTGAKLSEVLALDPFADIDPDQQMVFLGGGGAPPREVRIPAGLSREIQAALAEPCFRDALVNLLAVDAAFVRRKFYERARACGFDKRLGGPEMIRKARAVELMQGNLPLPAVQKVLGHATPNLASAYVTFSEEEIREMTRSFMAREAARKTSARNVFFGKIETIRRGDIQSLVQLITPTGHAITAMITNNSLQTLGLREGMLATAEVKAPWVILEQNAEEPCCSAENRCRGVIAQRVVGEINTEYLVRLADGAELCSIVGAPGNRPPAFAEGETVWALFNCFSVVLYCG
jgi:molybdate transport system regulatory protein